MLVSAAKTRTSLLLQLVLLCVIIAAFTTHFGDETEYSEVLDRRDAADSRKTDCSLMNADDLDVIISEEDKLLGLDDVSRPKIFFFETSGTDQLRARQSCAVESAAKHNPDSSIYVFTLNELNTNSSTFQIFKNQTRVRFVSRSFGRHFEGSPLKRWFEKATWKQSPYAAVHLSDALRLVTLWKYGGIYLDMDTITLRSLQNLTNTAGLTTATEIGNGVMAFDRLHPVLTYHMQAIQDLYNPFKWAYNGPAMLTAIYRRICREESLETIANEGCYTFNNVHLMNSTAFYLVPFGRYKDFFLSRNTADHWEAQLQKYSSFLTHAWNKETARFRVKPSDDSLYGRLARRECPMSYSAGINNYGYF